MNYFVLHKEGRTRLSGNSLFKTADRQLCVWCSEDKAIEHAKKRTSSYETWRVRPATSADFAAVGSQRFWVPGRPIYVVMDDMKGSAVAKKTTSVGCLVDVFEDLEKRKFAISSKAKDESEFITEVANAIGQASQGDLTLRMRELLPLIVDMCCKYRGYKAETVHERRELVAGDLEMPRTG